MSETVLKENYVESERGRTYYWTAGKADGSAETLVFLPGLTADHHLFDQQIEHFAERYFIIAWDAPAHGKSRPYKDYSYPHLAEELKQILDKESVDKAVLIGQSGGGFTAQSFIANYPERVDGFVCIGTCPYGTAYYSRSDIFWLKQTRWMFYLYPDKILRKTMAKMCCVTEAGQQNMLKMISVYPYKELCNLMYLGEAGFIPEICDLKINCPVCLIVGEHDHTGKVRQYMQKWHENEGYPLHVIENAAHNANDDAPEAVNAIIDEFLNTRS